MYSDARKYMDLMIATLSAASAAFGAKLAIQTKRTGCKHYRHPLKTQLRCADYSPSSYGVPHRHSSLFLLQALVSKQAKLGHNTLPWFAEVAGYTMWLEHSSLHTRRSMSTVGRFQNIRRLQFLPGDRTCRLTSLYRQREHWFLPPCS